MSRLIHHLLLIPTVFLMSIPSLAFAGWGTYPGCSTPDILIGDQVWASCNVSTRTLGSDTISGWFLYGKANPLFTSQNGQNWFTIQARTRSRLGQGACAKGYRVPTRYDWESLILNLRRNNENVSTKLRLPHNGSHIATYDDKGAIWGLRNTGYRGGYWTSTSEQIGRDRIPFVLHLAQVSGWSSYDSTDMSDGAPTEQSWTLRDGEQVLIEKSTSEVANIRCIRDLHE